MNLAKDAHIKIRKIREKKGLSQTFVAEQLGFKSSQAYANIEYGKTRLSFETAVKLASILDVSIDDFLYRKVKQKV